VATAAVALLLGCGGEEPTPLSQTLELAPSSVAELDLPGCDCVQLPPASVRWLRHPQDPMLVVATVDRCPVCVGDATDPAVRDASRAVVKTEAGIVGGGINSLAQMLPEDDPVPIRPEDGSGGEGGTSQESQGGDTEESPGVVLHVLSDDPVPIRDIAPLAPKTAHAVKQ